MLRFWYVYMCVYMSMPECKPQALTPHVPPPQHLDGSPTRALCVILHVEGLQVRGGDCCPSVSGLGQGYLGVKWCSWAELV